MGSLEDAVYCTFGILLSTLHNAEGDGVPARCPRPIARFLDIKCRKAGLKPSAVCLVTTCKSVKHHGGVSGEGYKARGWFGMMSSEVVRSGEECNRTFGACRVACRVLAS